MRAYFIYEGGELPMDFIYRVNGEERFPTDEERRKLFRQFMTGLGYCPVEEEKKENEKKD